MKQDLEQHGQSGQSLVQTLVAVAIMAILMMAMMSMFSYQSKELRSLKEKLGASDLQQQLLRTFADGSVCTSILTSPVALQFDSTNAVSGSSTLPSLHLQTNSIPVSTISGAPPLATAGTQASAIAPDLFIAGTTSNPPPFQITNIVGIASAGPGIFNATFQINFDQSKLIRSLHPATVNVTLQTTNAGGNLQKITSCSGQSSFSGCHTVPGSSQAQSDTTATATCAVGETRIGGSGGCHSVPYSNNGSVCGMSNGPTGNLAWFANCCMDGWAIAEVYVTCCK